MARRGMAEGVPERFADETIGKFRPDGLLLAHAGGGAGLFSAIIGGWANGCHRLPAGHQEGATMTRLLLDPTSERTVLRAVIAAASDFGRRQDNRAARHLQAARRRVLESRRTATRPRSAPR